MSSFILPPGDGYDKHCGEVFLTMNGNIILHCTLCENKYKGIHEYAVHIFAKHFDPIISDEDCTSTNSSEMLEEEFLIEADISVSNNFDTVLLEEEQLEVNFEDDKSNDISSLETLQNSDQGSQNNLTTDNEFTADRAYNTQTKKLRRKRPKRKSSRNASRKSKYKNDSISNQIRMLNEEAGVCLEQPTFKQPTSKTQIPDSERKHKCNFCGFAFKDEFNLLAHIKRHSDKKKYQCAYCSKMFFTRHEVEEHSRRHTGERPYQCDYENCDKSYYSRSALNVHIKRHKNERNYKCKMCGRGFNDSFGLNKHFATHFKEKRRKTELIHIDRIQTPIETELR